MYRTCVGQSHTSYTCHVLLGLCIEMHTYTCFGKLMELSVYNIYWLLHEKTLSWWGQTCTCTVMYSFYIKVWVSPRGSPDALTTARRDGYSRSHRWYFILHYKLASVLLFHGSWEESPIPQCKMKGQEPEWANTIKCGPNIVKIQASEKHENFLPLYWHIVNGRIKRRI